MNYKEQVLAIYPSTIVEFRNVHWVLRAPSEDNLYYNLFHYGSTEAAVWKIAWEVIADRMLEKLGS